MTIAASAIAIPEIAAIAWNNVLVGMAICLFAGYNYYRMTNGYASSTSIMSLIFVLGMWTFIAPFAIEGQVAYGVEGFITTIQAPVQITLMTNVIPDLLVGTLAAYIAFGAPGIHLRWEPAARE